MSWDRVARWRDTLRQAELATVDTPLSSAGARAVMDVALDALHDDALAEVAALGGAPFSDAVVVHARTVITAPVEWCAVLLGRGTRVTLKHPADAPGLAPLLVAAARDAGLALHATAHRDAIRGASVVVVLGSDETVATIRAGAAPHTRVLGHGHRFSIAWLGPSADDKAFAALATDAALHDGRGCLSPVALLTPLPLDETCARLASAMATAEARWPVGAMGPAEHAAIRSRAALARITGCAHGGPGYSVHGLPLAHLAPRALPRSLAVHRVATPARAARALTPWRRWLSTVGTDDPSSASTWLAAGATRTCPLGQMQRPPLLRRHDGVDWIAATARGPLEPR